MRAMTEPELKTASPLQVAKAVFWSFFGVRKRSDHEADIARLNPVHVIVMGILGAAIFIASLLVIVHFVVG